MNNTFEQRSGSSDHLNNLQPKATVSYRQSQREIDRIGLLKKIVPLLTVLVFVALVLWPILNSAESSFTLAIDRLEKRDETAKLVKPRYVGVDNEGNPVNVAAETAFRKTNDEKDYYLKNLVADLTMTDGTPIDVAASSGMLDADAQQLELSGSVKITAGRDFQVITEQAVFQINDKIAKGAQGVTGATAFGTFQANGFEADIKNEIIRLQGNVRLHYDPDKPLLLPGRDIKKSQSDNKE